MRIVIVCDVLGRENNGTTVAAMNLIRSLRAGGHEVRVVCPDEERRGEPGYYIIPQISLGPLDAYVEKNGVTISRPERKVLEEAMEGAEAIHLMVPFFAASAAARIARERGLPVTAGFHCQAENFSNHLFLMNARGFNQRVYQVFDRHVYSYVDCIHYPTQFIRDTYEAAVGHKTCGRVISNGVNSIFTPGPGVRPDFCKGKKYVIVFAGRFSREKSHQVLIEAVAASAHRDEIRLVFAGCGPLEEKLRKYGEKLLPEPPYMGFFSRPELVNLLRCADLYVHPAEIEIEAISCLEAIACGLVPVIADSPRSATRFFALGPENLFASGDARDLARRIDYWLEHPREKEARRQAYLGYARQFDQKHCMEEMERMILETAEKKNEKA